MAKRKKPYCILCETGSFSIAPGAVNRVCESHAQELRNVTFGADIARPGGDVTVSGRRAEGWARMKDFLLKGPPIERPGCFGSNPGPQHQAENDCHRCSYELVCLHAQPSYVEKVINELNGPFGRVMP